MATKIKTKGSQSKRIRTKGRKHKIVSPDVVSGGLGAVAVPGTSAGSGSPTALFALRAEVTNRLSSSGGRPSLNGTTRRQKIPLTDTDWALLEQLAETLADQEYRPSPSQVASILLHRALKNLNQAEDSEPPPELKTGTHE